MDNGCNKFPYLGNFSFFSQEIKDVPLDQVCVGDVLLVRPGEMIPADCIVLKGKREKKTEEGRAKRKGIFAFSFSFSFLSFFLLILISLSLSILIPRSHSLSLSLPLQAAG